MLMFECAPPFQWRPSYIKFGEFRRVMWLWFAVTICPYGINDLFENISEAAVQIYKEDNRE